MWQVDVPLGEFYDAIIAAARRAKYFAVLTALVREADSASFYEDICRYWDSLHDVTGSEVLFVLTGPNAASKVRDHGVPDGREPVAYSSPGAAVVIAEQKPLRPDLRHWAAQAGTRLTPSAGKLARSQTLATGQLRRRLGISEAQLPCLHLLFIAHPGRCESITIPISGRTVYELVKEIVSRFDQQFTKIRQLTDHLDHLRRSMPSGTTTFWNHSGERHWTPERRAAAHAIVELCAAASGSPDETMSARAECFRLLGIFKGTDDFRHLQRHIDINLNPKRDLARLGTERDINSTTIELEAAWKNISRIASEAPTSSPSSDPRYRIFIAYQSKDRWIAEHLHSSLSRQALTFLDVRCVRPGDRWVEQIRMAQDAAEVTVVLIGSTKATSWFQQAEYLRSIELARAGKQRLIPVYTEGSPTDAPYGLEGVQGIVTAWATGLRDREVQKVSAEICSVLQNDTAK
jgi:hypothetical protein